MVYSGRSNCSRRRAGKLERILDVSDWSCLLGSEVSIADKSEENSDPLS